MGALTSDEHRDDGIAEVAAAAHPLGHHRQEPAVEVLLPVAVVGGHAPCQLADIVVLRVVVLRGGEEELVYGVIGIHQRRLHVGLDVYRPPVAALHHLLEGNALQLAFRQRFPGPVLPVPRPELLQTLHLVVAQFVAALEEVLDETGYALLVVHLRDGLAVERLLVDGTEDATLQLVAHGDGHPAGHRLADTRLLRQSCLMAVMGQGLHHLLGAAALLAGLVETGVVLHLHPTLLGFRRTGVGIALTGQADGLVAAGHLTDDGDGLCIGIVDGLRVAAHTAARQQAAAVVRHLAVGQHLIQASGHLVAFVQQPHVLVRRLRPGPVAVAALHHHLQRLLRTAGEGQQRVR